MPRPKKTVQYTADDATILSHFDEALALAEQQKGASAEISAHNVLMAEDGVDPGTLSICRRLARMKPGKRGIAVALLHRYLQVLASRLEDPTVAAAGAGHNRGPSLTSEEPEAAAEPAAEAVPFVRARGAVAA
jgi:hypothetical protein